MLILKQINQPYEVRTCKISGEMIKYGDFFYEDDVDGVCVLASVYKKMQDQRRKESFDYSELNRCQSEIEYQNYIKRAEKEFLHASILDREIIDNGRIQPTGLD